MKFMLDIETMSLSTHNALVLSVAVASFTLSPEAPLIGDVRVWYPSLREQLALGRQVDEGTRTWWLRPEMERARRGWVNPPQYESTLKNLGEEMNAYMGYPEEVWANGIVFDIGNLESLIPAPWKYNATRDARTVYALPGRRTLPDNIEFVAHDAADDVRLQVWRLWAHWVFPPSGTVAIAVSS